jgi:hypothetical protein
MLIARVLFLVSGCQSRNDRTVSLFRASRPSVGAPQALRPALSGASWVEVGHFPGRIGTNSVLSLPTRGATWLLSVIAMNGSGEGILGIVGSIETVLEHA